jgi:AcrR family transcriptional regulator
MKPETARIRESIIERSRALFARHGITKTTIDDIARTLHMGKSSLYYYFKSKEEIFTAVLDGEVAVFGARIREAIAAADTPARKLTAFAVVRTQCFKELNTKFPALRDTYLTDHAFFEELRKDYDARELALLTSILKDGSRSGAFTVASIELTATLLLSILKGLEYEWTIKRDESDATIAQHLQAVLSIILHGISR